MGLFEIPGRRGCLRSAGVGNSIAGNAADGAIIDDPFGKREDADSPVVRQRIWDWYANDLYTRLSAEAWIVLTHTRWHRDDLAGRLLRKMADRAADQWEILCLPAVLEDGAAGPCDERRPGGKAWPEKVLWPEFKSAADLEIIRQQDARAFAALYQQNPADASQAEWAPELFGDWIWVQPEKWPQEFDLRVVCVDASKGKSDKQGDYCAIVFLGVGQGPAAVRRRPAGPDSLGPDRPQDGGLLRREAARFRGHRGRAVPGTAGPRVPPAVRRAVRPAVADLSDDDPGRRQGRPASAG